MYMLVTAYNTGLGDRKYYLVNEKMELIQEERYKKGATFSGSWKLTTFVHFNNFGYETLSVNPLCALDKPKDFWLFKNGKSKYRVRDYDHGTYRTWTGDAVVDFYEIKEENLQ